MGASPQMVDWDEDGDTDLLVGEYDGHIHYFENIGTATNPRLTDHGHLMVGGSQIDVSQLAIPVVNDWDEDGRKDLIVGNDVADIKLYINVGTNDNPVFSTTQYIQCTPSITQIKNAADIGDLNGDGLKDLAFGWWQGTVVYYPNRGTNANPVFDGDYELTALGATIDPGGWTHLELNDWDEDGDLDLVYGEWEGEVYIHLNLSNELVAELTPYGTPIQIPATGGSFDFNASLTNNYSQSINADVWTVAKLPSGGETAALVQATLSIPSGGQISRERTQNVPDYAPAGDYEYCMRWGQYPDQPWAESSFPFEKLGDGDGSEDLTGWICDGEPFEEAQADDLPLNYALLSAYPNPFNPFTVLSYHLQDASRVDLSVYDVTGNKIAELVNGWRDAGMHEVVFEASDLASGIYVYRLQTTDFTASGKLVLMK
jgi:hypothetical protein